MASSGRIVVTFAIPALVLGITVGVVWLGVSRSDLVMGPMRLLPLANTPEVHDGELGGEPPPTTLVRMTPLEAELRNALLPYSHAPLSLGARYRPSPSESKEAAEECMTSAIYYEAGREPDAGKRAVAQVILNRAVSASFPSTICGVVGQGAPRPGCQFTFMCDGSLGRRPAPANLVSARAVARSALAGEIDAQVGSATHYHANYVFPTWAPTMVKLTRIGLHIFYRWPGAHLTAEPVNPSPAAIADASLLGVTAPGQAPTSAPGASPTSTFNEAANVEHAEEHPTDGDHSPPAQAPPSVQQRSDPRPEQPPLPERRQSTPPRRAVPEQSLRTGPT